MICNSREICKACEIQIKERNQIVCDECHKKYQNDSWEDYPDLRICEDNNHTNYFTSETH